MVSVNYKQFSDFSYIPLKYSFNREETLNVTDKVFKNGLPCFNVEGLQDFQDTTYNKNTALILSNTKPLSSIFKVQENLDTLYPFSFTLHTKNYEKNTTYNSTENTILSTGNIPSVFYMQPVDSTSAELYVEGKLVYVEEAYPFTVRLKIGTGEYVKPEQKTFRVVKNDTQITFKCKTSSGFRYLAFNSDGILRATGCCLNETVINDYVFFYKTVTPVIQSLDFNPENYWITYYMTPEGDKNKTTTIDKNINVDSNYLFTFAFEEALKNKEATINVVTLKNTSTPAGYSYIPPQS